MPMGGGMQEHVLFAIAVGHGPFPKRRVDAADAAVDTRALALPVGRALEMCVRVDLACFDGEIARRGVDSCHITVMSPSGTS